MGVAGPGYPNSDYPRQLARERSLYNLTGSLKTNVLEAIVDETRNNVTRVEMVHVVEIDEALLEGVSAMSRTEYWHDHAGQGPFGAANFVYAQSCIDAPRAVEPPDNSGYGDEPTRMDSREPPPWVHRFGRQEDGRLCAVGYSLPVFFADHTFTHVEKDVRLQLSTVVTTLVSSFFEDRQAGERSHVESTVVASTQAVIKGAVVSHYWFDRHGVGPQATRNTTYGWGCVYPVEIVTRAVIQTEKQESPGVNLAPAVRKRARDAFEALDLEQATP